MWLAIPIALLCVIMKWSERKQGSVPKGDKVLWNTGGLLSILPERPERTDSKSERAN